MTTVYEIPLSQGGVSKGSVDFKIDVLFRTVRLAFYWNPMREGGWRMNIKDEDDNPLAMGIPLVTGENIVEQFPELGLPPMWVTTDGDPEAVPTFDNLGVSSHLYFAV